MFNNSLRKNELMLTKSRKEFCDFLICQDDTILLIAFSKGYLPIVKLPFILHVIIALFRLLNILLISKQKLEAKDKNQKETPLHYSCLIGNLPIVEYLIENGADIEAKTSNKETPLHVTS